MDYNKLLDDVATAQAKHGNAVEHVRIARSEETAALNRLNEAQKALDKALADLRKGAAHDSDWGRLRAAPAEG